MRKQLLAELLRGDRLPTPPVVALQIVKMTADPECRVADAVKLIELDPAVSAKLLRAANSAIYGLRQPVSSVARAVNLLGLKAVRGLVLGLSLPALIGGGRPDPYLDQLWMRSAAGAVLARELATREGRQPDDDFASALLRDLGTVVMRRHFGAAWDGHLIRHARRLRRDPCEAELESFGIDHADVGAELMYRWKLPVEMVEPIRFHHNPTVVLGRNRLVTQRAELLWMADQLAYLDVMDNDPDLLDAIVTAARDRFDLPPSELIAFLEKCDPAIQSLMDLLRLSQKRLPNVGATVAAAVSAMVDLRSTEVGADTRG